MEAVEHTDTPLEVAYSGRVQLRQLASLALFPIAYALLWKFGNLPNWIAIPGIAVFGVGLVAAVVSARPTSRIGTVVRLDTAGVTVRGVPTVPWRHLQGLVVGPMRPAWLVGSKRNQILAFIPIPGIELPGPPTPGRRPQSWGKNLRLRLYGTNLTIVAQGMTASTGDIAAAAERLGGIPIRTIAFHPARRLAQVAAIGVAAGVVGAIVVTYLRHR